VPKLSARICRRCAGESGPPAGDGGETARGPLPQARSVSGWTHRGYRCAGRELPPSLVRIGKSGLRRSVASLPMEPALDRWVGEGTAAVGAEDSLLGAPLPKGGMARSGSRTVWSRQRLLMPSAVGDRQDGPAATPPGGSPRPLRSAFGAEAGAGVPGELQCPPAELSNPSRRRRCGRISGWPGRLDIHPPEVRRRRRKPATTFERPLPYTPPMKAAGPCRPLSSRGTSSDGGKACNQCGKPPRR
jgi:hypothetical protein